MNNKVLTWGVVVGLVVAVWLGVTYPTPFKPAEPKGASTSHSFFEDFIGGLQSYVTINSGQTQAQSTTATTTTLTAAQICSGDVLLWNPVQNNTTTTLPTTATLQANCLPKAGNRIKFFMRSTGATTTYKIVAGTGQTLYHAMDSYSTTSTVPITITSSTPMEITVLLTLASGTDSTADVYYMKFNTP